MNLELKKYIDQFSKDRGIGRDTLIDTLEEAVRTSVQRRFGDGLDTEVHYNDETGDIEVFQYKVVVDEVEDPVSEVSFEEAKKLNADVRLNDEMGFRLKIEDFGRIAAQAAKQVIIQRMRDAEQEIIYSEYHDRIGEIVAGIIQRRDRDGWIINMGRTEALLRKRDQIPFEHFKRGDRVQAVVADVRREGHGPQILISRTHNDYLNALFRLNVPEVNEGIVKIMGIARDPGSRAKVAIFSKDRDIDPVGACVGIRGGRIQNIVQELHGERIDIVLWSPDLQVYAKNALSPAQVSRIVVNEKDHLVEVTVPDDQLTGAIGKGGQNVKLAAKLLDWKIDIFTEKRYKEANVVGRGLEQVANVADISLDSLIKAGFTSLQQLRSTPDEELAKRLFLTDKRLADLRSAVNFLTPVVGSADETEGEVPSDKKQGDLDGATTE